MKNKPALAQSKEIRNIDLNLTLNQGKRVMDKLEELGLKEATFETGEYFKSDKNYRAITSQEAMIIESENEINIRIPKKETSVDELINSDSFQPTQKMKAAYVGQSQSSVSKKLK